MDREGWSVSAVIPSYNRAELLGRAVASALAQTVSLREILIVDDGSTDETESIVAARFSASPSVKLICLPMRGGACAARNVGILAATGTHVAFLDSDDEWFPTKIEAQLASLGQRPSAIACFTGVRLKVGAGGKTVLLPPQDFRKEALSYDNVLGSTSTALVAREPLIAAGLFDTSMVSCQDWDLYRRLAEFGAFTTLCEPLILFDDGDHARISRNFAAVIEGHHEMARRIQIGHADPRETEALRLHHGFKAADLMAQVGHDPAGALRQGLALAISRPRPGTAWRLVKLLYRMAAKSWRDRIAD